MNVEAAELSVSKQVGATVRRGVSLAPFTTLKVGGPAEYFATVTTLDQMIKLVRWARGVGLPYYILGGGSNIVVSDAGIRGLVIYNRCRQVRVDMAPCCVFSRKHVPGEENDLDDRPFLFAEAGAAMAGAARTSMAAGLSGLEWAVSVPGTVGGAIVGNAGAHGKSIGDNLWNAMILDEQGDVDEVAVADLAFAYRTSALKQKLPVKAGMGPVVLCANFRLAEGDPDAIKATAEQYLQHRRRTQPVEPSAGSTFQNPPGDYAGRLIEAAGLKGARVGGVAVSEQHANFLINPGGVGSARSADVAELMGKIQETVKERFGVWLEAEVRLVGEWE